ncbi:MAG: hypothetical protein A2W61_06135 [Deltaproteobacteria bacterium RIFCSPLOWO2_01_44_7]|nr:MAG: hypothetical protein A2712_02025 [Deltaproteobacteria bacterium RIFCSPHIGHO2_01_FULL_43_49]OGQ15097.1 MAG: hypothetical protein A3D22_03455 [Deltaproteobacteria bacterium RIFCSPHIGHO2_02_FULL_44_53]OGQ27283.1 MAG: hypothetical protein A3D98_02620 [Deltaproteobacteria bacterium RIFCSPHIGHO2_12_FULL_44_21]OGQ31614.1 MAG: hypothetical protein A2979_04615 [Deltaproteobacteria bacterium RIFCSPLOWO2_01_FULL_45_74]OGQ42714.1 MAG: hypothetical protein A2W61_06135 [Deltaproteobacteria bacterium 
MKCCVLSILIACCLSQKVYAQANDDTRKALLGNDPNTTLTTGIGQVVQPVGTPVVQPLTGEPYAKPPPPALPSTTTTKQAPLKKTGKAGEMEIKVIYDSFEEEKKQKGEGTYELGELPSKKTKNKDQGEVKKAVSRDTLLSNQIFGTTQVSSDTYDVYPKSETKTIPTQKTKKTIHIPYSEPPPVQKIPYR